MCNPTLHNILKQIDYFILVLAINISIIISSSNSSIALVL